MTSLSLFDSSYNSVMFLSLVLDIRHEDNIIILFLLAGKATHLVDCLLITSDDEEEKSYIYI